MKKPQDHAIKVQEMFSRIASRYDLINRVMTFGYDLRWRTQTLQKLEIGENHRILDIGTGTGDLAFEIKEKFPDTEVVAADLTLAMVLVAKQRQKAIGIHWMIADAQHLPFKNQEFDRVVSGYLFRNVADLDKTLQEQVRVLSSEGRMVSLDTTPPPRNLLTPLIQFYLKKIIPFIGGMISGDKEAYSYLPDSTVHYLPADELANRIQQNGFTGVGFQIWMFGTMAIHWAKRSQKD
ncbi:MAG: ubiquinone/menaquinone biosynthesis methyltransferase [Anaerolineales bacterium]|nr:ubiquinone/menaquinone biosynthesis methyltransferase [Anaerolineales bacterium]